MSQTKMGSMVESVLNIAVGLALALVTQVLVFPKYGFNPGASESVEIAGLFTITSFIRSYTMRRVFNWLTAKGVM